LITVTTLLSTDENPTNDYQEIEIIIEDIHDVGPDLLNYPTGIAPLGTHTVNATIENYGNMLETNIPVNCSIYEQVVDTVHFDDDFEAKGTETSIFTEKRTMTEEPMQIDFLGGNARTDRGWTVWSATTPQWHIQTDNYYSPTHAWYCGDDITHEYGDNWYEWLISPPIDLTGADLSQTYIVFKAWIDTESGYDFAKVGASADNYSFWTWSTSGNSGGWIEMIAGPIDYPGMVNDTTGITNLCFILQTDSSVSNYEGYYIDDVRVIEYDEVLIYGDDETIGSLAGGESIDVLFTPAWTVLTEGEYIIRLTTSLIGDEDTANDVLEELVQIQDIHDVGVDTINYPIGTQSFGTYTVDATIENSGNVGETSIPVNCSIYRLVPGVSYLDEDMETDPGWTHGGTEDEWELGAPTSGPGSAHGGTNVYAIDLDGEYNVSSDQWLNIGDIDLTTAIAPTLTYWDWYEIESGWDYMYLEISTDGGGSWSDLIPSFSGNQLSWTQHSIDLSTYNGNTVQIRWRFTSDSSVTYDGYYLDDVTITDAPTTILVYGDDETIASLDGGESVNALFTPAWTVTVAGDYLINVTTSMIGDEVPVNNIEEIIMTIENQYDVGTQSINYPESGNEYQTGDMTVNATFFNEYYNGGEMVTVNCSIFEAVEGYFFDFETNDGGFIPTADWDPIGDWEYTDSYDVSNYVGPMPNDVPPPTAYSGDGMWGTVIYSNHANSSGTSYLSRTFDLSGMTDTELSFYSWCDAFASWDFGTVTVNGDQLFYIDDEDPTAWTYEVISLSAYDGMSSVEVVFGFYATSVVSHAGWYIDDVNIQAGAKAPGDLVYTAEIQYWYHHRELLIMNSPHHGMQRKVSITLL
jgi:hypothetical protein